MGWKADCMKYSGLYFDYIHYIFDYIHYIYTRNQL